MPRIREELICISAMCRATLDSYDLKLIDRFVRLRVLVDIDEVKLEWEHSVVRGSRLQRRHSTVQHSKEGKGRGTEEGRDMMSCHLMVEERILEGKEGCGGWAFLLENFFFNQSFHLHHT